jgi:hypothetical protein
MIRAGICINETRLAALDTSSMDESLMCFGLPVL